MFHHSYYNNVQPLVVTLDRSTVAMVIINFWAVPDSRPSGGRLQSSSTICFYHQPTEGNKQAEEMVLQQRQPTTCFTKPNFSWRVSHWVIHGEGSLKAMKLSQMITASQCPGLSLQLVPNVSEAFIGELPLLTHPSLRYVTSPHPQPDYGWQQSYTITNKHLPGWCKKEARKGPGKLCVLRDYVLSCGVKKKSAKQLLVCWIS